MKKYLLGFATFAVAFAILSVSVTQSSAVSYVLGTVSPGKSPTPKIPVVDYQMPYPGGVSPDSPFWNFKALRDKIWYLITGNSLRRAELALLFSDKRLLASKTLFENKKPDLALSTLSKGEKYLEKAVNEEILAREKGIDTSSFLTKLATASLKHRQMIEEFSPSVPEDIKPEVVKIENYSKNSYKSARDALNSKGIPSPKDPFDGQ